MSTEEFEFVAVLPLGSPLHISTVTRRTGSFGSAALCGFIKYPQSAGPIDDRLSADFVCKTCRRLYEQEPR